MDTLAVNNAFNCLIKTFKFDIQIDNYIQSNSILWVYIFIDGQCSYNEIY